MKMEILAVQNEFMHVMPSKSKDGSNTLRWTAPNVIGKKSQPIASPKRHHSHSNQKEEVGMAAIEQLWEDEDSFLTTLPHWNEAEIEHVRNVLMATLRDAKQRHLACTEVLLPCDMLERIAIDMLAASDEEACGIRGANIRIEFDNGDGSGSNEIATCNTDLNTVATFELRLTLKQEHSRSKWISAIMPQFIRNLTRASTIVISRDYTLSKHKLNYSFAE
ncbi:unnamed protein product [Chironomus riparius]|uniref:Uncharacterized protein n=1 Tax=Chironomus riparius TaxID=315576 RepID=A0A9N9S3V4_9DIPT|nr:unnamed protein product [Chironomus riparius]